MANDIFYLHIIVISMGGYDERDFSHYAIDNQVVGFHRKAVRLSAGRESHWYANWRPFVNDIYGCEQLAQHILAFTDSLNLHPDSFVSVPQGTDKLAWEVQRLNAKRSPEFGPRSHVLPQLRVKPKDHGDPKDKYFIGFPRGRTVVVEDVATTGESIMNTVAILTDHGVRPAAPCGAQARTRSADPPSRRRRVPRLRRGRAEAGSVKNGKK